MRHILFTLLLLFSNPIIAQELVEFENGQVADADDLNQSLQYLLSRIETLESRVDQLEPPESPTYTVRGGCSSSRWTDIFRGGGICRLGVHGSDC